jgi:hypothetical protein
MLSKLRVFFRSRTGLPSDNFRVNASATDRGPTVFALRATPGQEAARLG